MANRKALKTSCLLVCLLLLSQILSACKSNKVLSVDGAINMSKFLCVDSIIDIDTLNLNQDINYSEMKFAGEKILLADTKKDIVYSTSVADTSNIEEVYVAGDKNIANIGLPNNSDKFLCAVILTEFDSDWNMVYGVALLSSTGATYEYALPEVNSTDIAFTMLNEHNELIIMSSSGEFFVYSFNEADCYLRFKYMIEVHDMMNCIPLITEDYVYYFSSNEEHVYLNKKEITSKSVVSSIELSVQEVNGDRLFITNNPDDSKEIVFSYGANVYTTDFNEVKIYSNMIPSFYDIYCVYGSGDGLIWELSDCSSNISRRVLMSTHFEDADNFESKTLNIGYSNENSTDVLSVLSEEYMMFNPNVNINLTFYDIYSLGGLEDLRGDIINGEGPVVFYLNSGDYSIVDSVFEASVIEISELQANDEYNKSVIEAINIYGEGKIAAPYFEVLGVTVPSDSTVSLGKESYFIEDLISDASRSSYPEGVTGDFEELTRWVLMNDISLPQEEIVKMLDHLYEIYDYDVYHTEVFFHTCVITGFKDYYKCDSLYSDGMRMIGLPYSDSSLPLIKLDNFFILNEEHDDISQKFIDFTYSPEAQRVLLYSNKIPVLNSIILENHNKKNNQSNNINDSLTDSGMPTYFETASGEDLTLLEVSVPDPQKSFEAYITLINNLHNVMDYDSTVESIINEELSSFIEEIHDSSLTAKYITERVDLYLSDVDD